MSSTNLEDVMEKYIRNAFVVFALLMSANAIGEETFVRIKDLTNIKGVRENALIGYGLVVGLQGTGDSAASLATNKSITNLVNRLGMEVGELTSAQSAAGVIVTANLPPFASGGDTFDVKVSVIGDAVSLQGGTLVLTPLKAGDGQIYGFAQGAIVTGRVSGNGGGVLTVATVPSGARIERDFSPKFVQNGKITLSLIEADFTNAERIVEVINRNFRGFYAESRDPGSVTVRIPPLSKEQPIRFISALEKLTIPVDEKAVVLINERTGTIVMGGSVVVSPVAIAHGDLSIRVLNADNQVTGTESVSAINGATIGDLVESLNKLGAAPSDMVGILKALKASGALKADLKFI